MNDQDTYFRIARWRDTYDRTRESDPDSPTRKAVDRKREPLSWVKLQVHGHELGEGWRDMQQIAGESTLAAFGLFCKLLELAADEPKDRRDGTIYSQGRPASADRIAFLINAPADLVRPLLSMLVAADWVLELRAATCSCAQLRADERLDRDRDREGELEGEIRTETETEKQNDREERCADAPSVSVSGEGPPETPAKPTEPPRLTRNNTRPAQRSPGRNHEPANASDARLRSQIAADVATTLRVNRSRIDDLTTIHRAVGHATREATGSAAITAVGDQLRALAADKMSSAAIRNPRAAWTAAVVQHWGAWTEHTGPPGPSRTDDRTTASLSTA